MKTTDIKVTDEVAFSPRRTVPPLPGRLRREEVAFGTIVKKSVKTPDSQRTNAVTVKLSDDLLARCRAEDTRFPTTVMVRLVHITETVAERELRESR